MASRRDAGIAPDPRRLVHDAARRLLEGRARDPEAALALSARALGLRDRARLPPASMVVEAACAEQRLFGGEAHARGLASLRRSAAEAMRFLSDHEPRLVGGVLDGWAGIGATIEIQLFTDDDEGLFLRLAEIGVRPRVHAPEPGPTAGTRPRERLSFLADGVPIELSVFRSDDLRRRTVAPGLGRARLEELEALLARA